MPVPVPDAPGDHPGPEDPQTSEGSQAEREWWDDPRMPWKGKPGRADLGCWAAISLTGIYGLVLLPLRPILLGANPFLLAALGGSRTSTVTIGALAAVGESSLVLGLVLSTIGSVKFDWIFWWAGRLWGRGLIEVVAGRSPRAARNAARAERLAARFGIAAVALTSVIPLPAAVVYASVAAAGMRLRTFLVVDILSTAALKVLWLYLGYSIGQPAIDVVEVIADYSLWISLALVAGIMVNFWWQSRRRAAGTSAGPES